MEPIVQGRDPRSGTVLGGRYRLGEPIGSGGAGTVFRARQLDLGREVAVKILRPELAADPELLERFRREAKAAASLEHPHIAHVHDWGEPVGGEPAFIVLELLEAPSLASVLARGGRLPVERAVRLSRQLLSALEAAHRAGIVHRDIKPANLVLVTKAGLDEALKVIDFGIAHVAEGHRLTRDGSILGTPRFMAPEQLRGEPVDARTDVWAAGVVLYRALSGRLPFDGPHGRAIEAILGAELPPLDPTLGVPPHVAQAIARALEKRPGERFPSAAAFADALAPPRRAEPTPRERMARVTSIATRPPAPPTIPKTTPVTARGAPFPLWLVAVPIACAFTILIGVGVVVALEVWVFSAM